MRLGVRAAERFEVKSPRGEDGFSTKRRSMVVAMGQERADVQSGRLPPSRLLGMGGLVLAAMLAAVPACAGTRRPMADAAYVSKAVRRDAAAVARQRAVVRRLQHDVAAQESSSRTADQRLKQQDARIAELQRQLQAAQQGGAGAGKGR